MSVSQVEILRTMEDDNLSIQHIKFGSATIMVGPIQLKKLTTVLKEMDIAYKVIEENVASKIARSSHFTKTVVKTARGREPNIIELDEFNDHANINIWLGNLAAQNEFVETVTIGKTFEGREQKAIRFVKAGKGKPHVYIQAGIHSREWISISTAVYMIDQLVNNKDDEAEKFLSNLNIHIVPVVNPDGYIYTDTTDRYWRKTRSSSPESPNCFGVDANRNYGFHWGGAGVSHNPCDKQVYCGPNAFSEVEVRNTRDYLTALDPKPILAIDLHSYGGLVLTPYGYEANAYPENNEEIVSLGKEVTDAISNVHNENFITSNIVDGMYPASGSSTDWFAGGLGARFSYILELRGEDFVISKENIIPSGQEIWAGHKVMFNKMIELSSGQSNSHRT